jgi:hypothetical protein
LGAEVARQVKKKRKRFFFEKKNQKTFVPWCGLTGRGTNSKPRSANKSFLVLFFKKELLRLPS